jgi:hypothetical protein
VLILLGGVAFPLSRITLQAWLAHVAKLLLLIPFVLLPLLIRRRRGVAGRAAGRGGVEETPMWN